MEAWIIFGAVVIIVFDVLETCGILRKFKLITLSETIRYYSEKYPLSRYLFGAFTGAMAIHLFFCNQTCIGQ
jgi:hypothetical protein